MEQGIPPYPDGTGLLSYNHPLYSEEYMSKKQRNTVEEELTPEPIPTEEQAAFIQKVWETTYSACLAGVLASRTTGLGPDKFLVRDIHRALDLANIARDAAKSYIDNQQKQEAEAIAAREGDPLNKLLSQDQP